MTQTRHLLRVGTATLAVVAAVAVARQEVEPISLAGWSGDPPSVVADDFAFELRRVSAKFTTHHGLYQRYPVGGAWLRVHGWVSPPDPRVILGARGTLVIEEVIDGQGRELVESARTVEPVTRRRRFRRGAPSGVRPGFSVESDVHGCAEVPGTIRSLRGHVSFPVVETVETLTVPLVIAETLAEIHPGLSVRVTEVAGDTEPARAALDYAILNAADGYDRETPPFLLDGWLVDAKGERPRRQTWTPTAGRNVLLHTGLHSAMRFAAYRGDGPPVESAVIEVITAIRTVTIPFHFTDLSLSPTPAPADPGDLPAYRDRQKAPQCVVEHDEILLGLNQLSSDHEVSLRGDAEPSAHIRLDFGLRLPPGVWTHARRPVITDLVDHTGEAIAFTAMPATPADDLTYYRRVTTQTRDIRLSFTAQHDRPPPAGLKLLRGYVPVRRALSIETIELPWALYEDAEVRPGLRIQLGEPEGDLASQTLPVTIVRLTPDQPISPARLPVVLDVEVHADDGSVLRRQRNMTRTDELDDRTIERGRLIVTKVPADRVPVSTVWTIVTEAEEMKVHFAFEDLLFRVAPPVNP